VTWWTWTVLWIVLVVGALYFLFVVGRSLFRKGMALVDALGAATERLSAVTDELQSLTERPPTAEEPAIFADPAQLRAARFVARRRGRDRSRRDPSRDRRSRKA
jgi:hypothetical protein